MDEQQTVHNPKNKTEAVQSSVKKFKEKAGPGVKYTLLISAIANFAVLVVGCLNVHRCPVEKHIPLFLIATGAIGLVSKFITLVKQKIEFKLVYLESGMYSVETIFFFLGTYWVYKEFQPSYDPRDGMLYCNKTAYIFAFSYLTIVYAFFIALLCGFCCLICCTFCLAVVVASDEEAQNAITEAATSLTKDTEVKP